MQEITPENLSVLTGGGIASGIAASLLAVRYIWKTLSGDRVDTTRDSATTELINNMSQELKRLADEVKRVREECRTEIDQIKKDNSREIQSMRETHASEKSELFAKIERLEQSFETVKRKNASMRAEALDAYAYIMSNASHCDDKCFMELKEKIMKIAISDKKRPQ